MQASDKEEKIHSSMDSHDVIPLKSAEADNGPDWKTNTTVTVSATVKGTDHTNQRAVGVSKKLDNKHNLARSIARKVEGRPLKVYRWALATSTGMKVDKILAHLARRARKKENGSKAQSPMKLRKRPGPVKRIAKKVWHIYFRYFPPFLLVRWMLDAFLLSTKMVLAFLRDIKKSLESTNQQAKSIPNEPEIETKSNDLRETDNPSFAKSDKCKETQTRETKRVAALCKENEPDSNEPGTPILKKVAEMETPAIDSSDGWESAMSSPEQSPCAALARKAMKSQAEFNYSKLLNCELRKLTSSLLGALLGYFIGVFTFLVITTSSISSTVHRWAGVPEFNTSHDCIDKTDLLVRLVGYPECDEMEKDEERSMDDPEWLLDRVLEQGVKDFTHIPGLTSVFRFLGIGPRLRITGKLLDIVKGAVTITNRAQTNKPVLAEYLVEDPVYVEENDPDYMPSAGSSSEESLECIDDSEITLTEEEEEEDEKEEDTVKEETEEDEEKHDEFDVGNVEERKKVRQEQGNTQLKCCVDQEKRKTGDFEDNGAKAERSQDEINVHVTATCEKTSKTMQKTIEGDESVSSSKETNGIEKAGAESADDKTKDSGKNFHHSPEKGDNKDKSVSEGNPLPVKDLNDQKENGTEGPLDDLHQPVLDHLATATSSTLSSASLEKLACEIQGSLKQSLTTTNDNSDPKGKGAARLPPISTVFKSTNPATSSLEEAPENVQVDKGNKEKTNSTDGNVDHTVQEGGDEEKPKSENISMTNEGGVRTQPEDEGLKDENGVEGKNGVDGNLILPSENGRGFIISAEESSPGKNTGAEEKASEDSGINTDLGSNVDPNPIG